MGVSLVKRVASSQSILKATYPKNQEQILPQFCGLPAFLPNAGKLLPGNG